MDEWKYLKKLRQSEKRSVLIAVAVMTGILALAAIVCFIVKHCLSHGCNCENCGCGEDFDDDDDHDDDDDDHDDDGGDDHNDAPSGGCDENGCCYTNDKDFVE